MNFTSSEKLLLFDARKLPYTIDRFTFLATISSILRGATIGRLRVKREREREVETKQNNTRRKENLATSET